MKHIKPSNLLSYRDLSIFFLFRLVKLFKNTNSRATKVHRLAGLTVIYVSRFVMGGDLQFISAVISTTDSFFLSFPLT